MSKRFRICLRTSLTGFAADLVLASDCRQWDQVPATPAGARTGCVIEVPDFVFDSSRCVADEKAYRIVAGHRIVPEQGRPEQGSVAIILESPHRDEFAGRGGEAIGPLRNQEVRDCFEFHLPRIISATAGRLGTSLVGASVSLVNAVQYQTSLQSLMRDYEGALQAGIRTPVWNAIFRNGGSSEFLDRLRAYRPRVLLVATTYPVRKAVRRALARDSAGAPWIEVNYHPSWWRVAAPDLLGELHRPSGARP